MTIIEALKTGKPFKLPQSLNWTMYDPDRHNGWFYDSDEYGVEGGSTSLDLYYEDLISTKWSVKDET